MKKYIIIVSVYDQENTQAYPIGGVFDSHLQAELFLSAHVNEIKSDHWTRDCVDGEDYYKEEFSIGGSFHAQDTSDGSALDIVIHEVPMMSELVPVSHIDRNDLVFNDFDVTNVTDDNMESIASRMDKWYRDGYCTSFNQDLIEAAREEGIPELDV